IANESNPPENSLVNCYPCLEERLELKTLNEITIGINMSLKNFNDLETKFKDETIEEVEEIEEINITIDGLTSTGKSTIGRSLALKLNYRFIDSRLFYYYLASKTASQDEQELLSLLQQDIFKHIFQLNESVFFENEKYIENSSRAKKKYIISGRDFATNILPNAELKILLTANFKTHVQRRLNQLKNNNYNDICLDIIKQNTLSIEFIKEITKLSTIFVIDTTYLSIEEVVDKILLKTSNTITRISLDSIRISVNSVKKSLVLNLKISTTEKGDELELLLLKLLRKNSIECYTTRTSYNVNSIFVLIGDGGTDLFGNYKLINYIMQVKNKSEKYKVGPGDIREFSAVLAKQLEDTIEDLTIENIEIDSDKPVLIFGMNLKRNVKISKLSIKCNIKNSKPNPKVIVAFGSIGARKTTFLIALKDFFENQGKKVYFPEEMSLRFGEDLEYFYQDTRRYGFMFQDLLIDAYQKKNKIIRKDEYDIYLIDRTTKDTMIFSKILINDKLKLDYFKKKLKKEEKINAKYNFFIKYSPKICYE
ncbi:35576_t:CDS:2, partial [Racocetra persica]